VQIILKYFHIQIPISGEATEVNRIQCRPFEVRFHWQYLQWQVSRC